MQRGLLRGAVGSSRRYRFALGLQSSPWSIFAHSSPSPQKSVEIGGMRWSTRTRGEPIWPLYESTLNTMYEEGECLPIPAFLEDKQPEGWQLPPEEEHMCMPQFIDLERLGLSPPFSPYICDRRGYYYLCECEGRYYLLQGTTYAIYQIDEPDTLEKIVSILPNLMDLDGGVLDEKENLLKVLKTCLKITSLEYKDEKKDQ